MFEFSLLKSLFFEMDKYKMEGVTQTKKGKSTYRRLEVHYDTAPQIFAITAEERILPYLDRYYLYINDEKVPADLKETPVKQVIYEFYKEKFPAYLKEGVPDNMENVNILDCFEVFNMPDYRPKHAFPGLELVAKREEGKPTAADFEGYTAFDGDREGAQNKINDLKKQFASQLESFNVDGILDDIMKEEPENV